MLAFFRGRGWRLYGLFLPCFFLLIRKLGDGVGVWKKKGHKNKGEGWGGGRKRAKIRTLQISLRTLFLCSGQGCVDEGIVFAEAFEIAGLAARRADGGEGWSFLWGGMVLALVFFWGGRIA